MRPGLYDGLAPQIRREIGWSLASAAIYGIPAGVVAWGWAERGWTLIYTDWQRLSAVVPAGSRCCCYLFAHDTWFYWTHRLFHRPWWFRSRSCGAPRKPPADRVGGDELPPGEARQRRGGDPGAGVPGADPCRRCSGWC